MGTVWLWAVLGLVLLGLEMATGTLYILWFGIAALLLAGLDYLLPSISIPLQIFLFALLSLGSLLLWRYVYKKTSSDLRIGQSQGEEIGRVGTIIEAVSPKQNGKIQFAQGVMGSRVWAAIGSEEIAIGADAVIIAVEGNSLRVKQVA